MANEVANIHKNKKIEPPKDKNMYQEKPWTLVSHRILGMVMRHAQKQTLPRKSNRHVTGQL